MATAKRSYTTREVERVVKETITESGIELTLTDEEANMLLGVLGPLYGGGRLSMDIYSALSRALGTCLSKYTVAVADGTDPKSFDRYKRIHIINEETNKNASGRNLS